MNCRNKKGFYIVEVLVTAIVFLLIWSAIYQFFGENIKVIIEHGHRLRAITLAASQIDDIYTQVEIDPTFLIIGSTQPSILNVSDIPSGFSVNYICEYKPDSANPEYILVVANCIYPPYNRVVSITGYINYYLLTN